MGDVNISDTSVSSLFKARLDCGDLSGVKTSAKQFELNIEYGDLDFSAIDSNSLSAAVLCGDVELSGSLNGNNIVKCNLGDCLLSLDKSIL